MFYISKRTQEILDCYANHLPIIDTVQIGFTGVASERPPRCETDQVSADVLWFGLNRDFEQTDVLLSIQSITPQYAWMISAQAQPQLTPIGAVAGASDQVMPVLPLPTPFFVESNGVITMQFENSATDPVDEGLITWIGVKLTGPINGGWRGYTASK